MNVNIAGRPELLELAKWSKLGPALDWVMMCLLGGICCSLFAMTSAKFPTHTKDATDASRTNTVAPSNMSKND